MMQGFQGFVDPNAFKWGDRLGEARERRGQQDYNTTLMGLLTQQDYGGAAKHMAGSKYADPNDVMSVLGFQQQHEAQQRAFTKEQESQFKRVTYALTQQAAQIADPQERLAFLKEGTAHWRTKPGFENIPDFDMSDVGDDVLARQLRIMETDPELRQETAKPMTVSDGADLVSPSGELLYSNPKDASPSETKPRELDVYDPATGRQRRVVETPEGWVDVLTRKPIDVENAQLNAPDLQGGFDTTQKLRKEWTSVTSDFQEVSAQYANLDTLSQRRDSASDLALIVAFTKILDPGSVAREGEVQLSQKAAGLLDNVVIWEERIRKGETLLPDSVRSAYVAAAKDIYETQLRQIYQKRRDEYMNIAQQSGIDPTLALPDFTNSTGAGSLEPSEIPNPGDVVDWNGANYRFKGGDPANPGNWEPVD